MAKFCETVFASPELKDLNLRYFDPTLSAAQGHEDKGLIECLMVKCSKLLIYTAGKSDSYGKDAEAAMALTLGKPVIFYCDETYRRDFFTDIHPLSRLIAFSTGVAVGVMAVSKPEDVIRLVERIFYNRLRFKLQRSISGHLRLVEEISECTVRVQTSDLLLRETFWNCYHPSGHA